MESMEEKLQEYAQLLVQVGLNVQKGQTLVISAPRVPPFPPASAPGRPMPPAAGKW